MGTGLNLALVSVLSFVHVIISYVLSSSLSLFIHMNYVNYVVFVFSTLRLPVEKTSLELNNVVKSILGSSV